ncbi:MAG: hypothetical protein WCH99_11700 [Verrucomicrobiota bacterium]
MLKSPITLMVNQVSQAEHREPHRRIRSIHGPVGQGEWQHTQTQAIDFIERWQFSYYMVKDGRPVRLVIGRTADGETFLKTELDGDIPTLLLQLPPPLPATNQPRLV